jgi:hypothetical protein
MTTVPDFTGLTALNTANVSYNSSMTSAPDFTGLTSLYNAYVNDNASMTTAPSFSGCYALYSATVNNNALMTTAPDFTGLTALNTANISACAISDTSILTALQQVYDYAYANAGYFDCSGGTNASLDPAAIEITQLQDAGWTVVFNSL